MKKAAADAAKNKGMDAEEQQEEEQEEDSDSKALKIIEAQDVDDELAANMDPNALALLQERARDQWLQYRSRTDAHAMRLCEQLRLVLEPTLATRLQGDYRTGKRINMRKVISYISSGFRKDKIWLRRTKPAKRDYQVLLMIDDSSSMGLAGPLALQSMAMISTALTRLEVGDLCVTSFADSVKVLHPFGKPFTEESGADIIGKFQFGANQTKLASSLEAMIPVFEKAKSASSSSSLSNSVVLQLCFVISDARMDSDNRERLDKTVRELAEKHILVVLVIIDHNSDPKNSIFNTRMVNFVDNKVVTTGYFDDFPFPYYVAIQHLDALPDVLADALKQWFELVRVQLSNN